MKTKSKFMLLILLAGMILYPSNQPAFAAANDTMLIKYGEYLYRNYIVSPQDNVTYFSFIDLSGDGQKELVVYDEDAMASDVYDYENGEVALVDLGNQYKVALEYYKAKKRYYFVESMGPYISYFTISIKNHKATRINELRSTSIDDTTEEYTFRGKVISFAKYDQLFDKYYGGILNGYVQGHKITASNITKYCNYTEAASSSLSKITDLAVTMEYVEADYAYNEIFSWAADSGADGYELYRKQIDIRLSPSSNYYQYWLYLDWEEIADVSTNQYIISHFRPGDKLNLYVVRPYTLKNDKKVYGPYSTIFSLDEMGFGRI